MATTSVRDIELILPGSFGKETLSNDGMQNLALGISGAVTIALTGTDVTLTEGTTGQAQHFVQILTGTLTANVNVIVPAESRVYIADNRTTGPFTVTVKTAAGGGIAVDQGVRTLIYCDGINVYPVAGASGGGGSGAPTDATYLVQTPHALLTGERAVTDTATVTWDFATAGQARAHIPDGAVTYAKLQDAPAKRLLGRYAPTPGDVQEVTLGTGLNLDDAGTLTATVSGSQPLDATLTALAGVTTGANTIEYFAAVDVAASTPLTPFARTLLDDADQAAMQTTLGVVPGTDVQPLDATLTALAGVTTGADRLAFFTGIDTATTTLLTPFMRSLLDDTTAAQARSTLEIAAGGAVSFLDLTDTDPTTYAGQAGKVVLVNASATGLAFGTVSAGLDPEAVQDLVGAMATDSATLDFSYDDTTGTLTGVVKDTSLTEAKLSLSDVTTQDASTTQHGLLRKLSGTVTEYLDGTGAWSTPAGGGGAGAFQGCRLTRSTVASSINATTQTLLTWDTEDYDTHGFHEGVTQPSRITIPAGITKVRLTAGLQVTGYTGNAGVAYWIRKNGTAYVARMQMTSGVFNDPAMTIESGVITVTTGDYFDTIFQTGDSTTNIEMSPNTFFSCAVIESIAVSPGDFLALTDTPDTYSGQGGNLITVNSGATALDFTTLTAAGRALLDDADAEAQRETLGLGTLAQQDASAVAITGGSATGLTQVAIAGGNVFVDSQGFHMLPQSGNDVAGLRATVHTAGGTNRFGVSSDGTAPNYFAGNVGIANNTPSYTLDVTGNARVTQSLGVGVTPSGSQGQINLDFASSGLVTRCLSAGAGKFVMEFRNSANVSVGAIVHNDTSTAYNTSSDVRLKQSIAPLTDSLAVIAALNPVSHRWNVDDSYGESFLAHELQQVLAYAVTGEPDAVNDDGSVKPQQVDQSKLVPRLVGAVKELLAQVDAITARVATLEEALGL